MWWYDQSPMRCEYCEEYLRLPITLSIQRLALWNVEQAVKTNHMKKKRPQCHMEK